MKKKITYLLMVALIVFSLAMPCYADEVTTLEETVVETTAEPVVEPTEGVVVEAEQQVDTTEENATEPSVDVSAILDEVKGKIADSSIWAVVGSSILAVVTIIGIVKTKFGWIVNAFTFIKKFFGVGDGDDGKTLEGTIGSIKENVVNEVREEFKSVKDTMDLYQKELAAKDTNDQKLYAMMTIFFANVKMPESARAELLEIATGIKQYAGNACDIAEQAQAVIDANVAEAEKDNPETPTLDEIVEEYMELG